MKTIMTTLGAAALLAATAHTAWANSDVAEIAQEFARSARPAWNEFVKERRASRPERLGNDEQPVGSREWWDQVDRYQGGRRR
jgi:hypothetical protein